VRSAALRAANSTNPDLERTGVNRGPSLNQSLIAGSHTTGRTSKQSRFRSETALLHLLDDLAGDIHTAEKSAEVSG